MSELLDFIVSIDSACVPETIFQDARLFPAPCTFAQLALLYSKYEKDISFINFLFQYECMHIYNFNGAQAKLDIPTNIFFCGRTNGDMDDVQTIENYLANTRQDPYWNPPSQNGPKYFNLFSPYVPKYGGDKKPYNKLFVDMKTKYIQILVSLSDQNEFINTPVTGNKTK